MKYRTPIALSAAILALPLLVTAWPQTAEATGEQKIAVVDLQRVLLSTKAGKAAKDKFEAIQMKKKKQLQRTDAKLQKREKELLAERVELEKVAKGKSPAQLPPEVQKRVSEFLPKLKEFQEEVLEFQKTQKEVVQSLAKREAELLKPIEDQIRKVIDDIAKAKGYTIVLTRMAVVYAAGSTDITAEVTSRMNGK